MRIIFISGFGEDEFIFDKIEKALPGEKLFLSLWKTVPDTPVKKLNVAEFAKSLVDRFAIKSSDVVIGHSAGGWVAAHIKNIVGCPIIQVSSWTDTHKVIVPFRNRHVIYFAAKTGLYLNRFVMRQTIKKFYNGKPSREVFEKVFTRILTGNRANAVNQLRLIFNPYPAEITVAPDLRIHARKDSIVRFPDEEFYEVEGDHFSLYSYPEQVLTPILDLINHHAKK